MDKITLRMIFKQPFANEHWNRLLVEVFHASDVYETPQQFTFDNENAKYVGYFNGHVETPTGDTVGLFSYSSSLQVSRKKVSLRNLVAKIINPKYGSFDAAIVAYYDEKEWRISYICDLKNSSTSAKRFSFLVGDPNSEHNTAVNRLCEIKKDYELSDLFNAFSVERLTKEFFNEYTAIYKEFCDRAIDPKYFDFDGLDKKKIRDYVKLLLGRILFLCFVQKKGWMNGDKHFLRNIFDAYCNQIKTGEEFRFLDYVLEKIFFECLNKNHSGLYQTIVLEYGNNGKIDVPFLNGGLFECKELDIPRSVFGKELWLNLFNLLGSYNFTIDENDPTDAEIGIDPEMLGKIFESQLEDNKDKGAFYTPKEIVSYMCKESLIAYLEKSGVDKEELRTFVKHHELCDTWNDITKNNVLVLLKNIKVCDPAIGSGAFPMGMLREILYCRLAIESSENIAEIKREIIQNCIYGVDIEAGAVDIARLRFWLSIVVDSDKPEPLPNLDYKIMQGNSLLESYDGEMLDNLLTGVYSGSNTSQNGSVQVQMAMDFGDESNYRIELKRLLNNYFTTSSDEKKKLQDKIQNIVKKILITRRTKLSIDGKLEKIDIHSNSDFFLWHTWFADVFENGGFDVVIGNPPYIQLQSEEGKLGELYSKCGYSTFARTGDIYCLFYECGWLLLKQNGHLCYITSNKWMRAGYGEKTRDFFANKTNPILLIDFAGMKIFESATVDTNILLFSKANNQHKTVCAVSNKQNKDSVKNLSDFVQQQNSICDFSTSDSWVVLSPIEQSIKKKIEAVGTPLKDWDINIYRGVLTGCNEAFIIDSQKRDEILSNCQTETERQRTDELIRPILRGRDIKRYGYVDNGLYLINTHNGIKGKLPRIEINDYPAIKAHLNQYWDKISTRTDKGDTPYNLRNCAYLEDFNKPKIIFQEIVQSSQFMYDETIHYMCNDTGRIIVGSHLPFVLSILNSKLFFYAVKKFYGGGILGEHGIRMKHTFFGNFPCLPYNKQIEDVTKELINSKDSTDQIDALIFSAYSLSREEITLIEEDTM